MDNNNQKNSQDLEQSRSNNMFSLPKNSSREQPLTGGFNEPSVRSSEERQLEFGKSGSGWSLNDPSLKSEFGKMATFD